LAILSAMLQHAAPLPPQFRSLITCNIGHFTSCDLRVTCYRLRMTSKLWDYGGDEIDYDLLRTVEPRVSSKTLWARYNLNFHRHLHRICSISHSTETKKNIDVSRFLSFHNNFNVLII
jgi:hypothetical protein